MAECIAALIAELHGVVTEIFAASLGVQPEVRANRATMLGIWADVKANGAKLAACQRHEFFSESPGKMGAKWRCTACGGTVSGTNAHWYSLGRKHG